MTLDTTLRLPEPLTPWARERLPGIVGGPIVVSVDGHTLTRAAGWDDPARRRLAGLVAASMVQADDEPKEKE
jgi:hypothetical protein